MTTIIQNLSSALRADIKMADEIYVAVALMTHDGLQFLINNLPKSCQQNYLVGIDLPTDPKALEELNKLQYRSGIEARLCTDKVDFHPKLYLIKKKDNYSAFVGSANCTNGGLFKNIELTVFTTDQKACDELLKWFKYHFQSGQPLTTSYIKKYQRAYLERRERKRQEEKLAKKEKIILNNELEATMAERAKLLEKLRQYRKKSEYNGIVSGRRQDIQNLRVDIDYPAFYDIDIDTYFSHYALGHLIPIALPAIKRNITRLREMLRYLCDESIDIAIRYNRALHGDLRIERASDAFISKALAVHRPDLYFVKNSKSEKALRKFGINLPRGLNAGEKYKSICHFLRQVYKDANMKDLAVLDYYLYLEGSNDD